MFNYLFPIFCFGLVMTGIVFLGILEAGKHAKADEAAHRDSQEREPDRKSSLSDGIETAGLTARTAHE